MREYLKSLGFTEEQIEGIMAEHGKLMAKTQEEIKRLKEQAGKAFDEADYEKLYAENKKLQEFVSKRAAERSKAEVDAALEKQKRIADEKLSREEKLRMLQGEDLVNFLLAENKALQTKYERDKEIEGLRAQTAALLKEGGVPDEFLSVFDFGAASAEDIHRRAKMLSGYEYHARGALQKAVDEGVAAGVAAKLKQAAPEDRGGGDAPAPPKPIPVIF
jgi:hypothetical protein